MKVIRCLLYFGIALVGLGLSLGLYQHRFPNLAYLGWVLGLLWAIASWRRWIWVENLVFILSMLLLGVFAWIGAKTIWLLVALIGAITAWDLERFVRVMDDAPAVRNENQLIQKHILRLGGVLVIGAGLSLLTLFSDFRISFGWMLILTFVMILALSRVIGFIRRN